MSSRIVLVKSRNSSIGHRDFYGEGEGRDIVAVREDGDGALAMMAMLLQHWEVPMGERDSIETFMEREGRDVVAVKDVDGVRERGHQDVYGEEDGRDWPAVKDAVGAREREGIDN